MEKSCGVHSTRRTYRDRIALPDVGERFTHAHAAGWVQNTPVFGSRHQPMRPDNPAPGEYKPSSAGVVRRMSQIGPLPLRLVPRCSRTSRKVVSIRQRNTKLLILRRGQDQDRCKETPEGSRSPEGSPGPGSQRIRAGGMPLECHFEVADTYFKRAGLAAVRIRSS